MFFMLALVDFGCYNSNDSRMTDLKNVVKGNKVGESFKWEK